MLTPRTAVSSMRTMIRSEQRISRTPSLSSVIGRLRAALSLRRREERRNIDALATHLGIPYDDASWIYRRSRQVGYPTAMAEFAAVRDARDAVSADS